MNFLKLPGRRVLIVGAIILLMLAWLLWFPVPGQADEAQVKPAADVSGKLLSPLNRNQH